MTPFLTTRPRTDRAFERIYQRYVGEVYRYAFVVLRSREDAEDVTQTAFLNAYRAYQKGERPERPRNWLIAIAHNVCRQRFRQSMRRPQQVAYEEDVGADAVPYDDAPSAHEIRRALDQLAFNQRAALVMRELEGRSYQEIGTILGLSVGAVETLIFRARRALREQLEGSLSCHEAEFAVSRQLDGQLPRDERGALRAHLRECSECAHFARSQRAQRSAWKALALVPVPSTLSSFFGGTAGAGAAAGGAAAGAGIAAKTAAVIAAGAAVGGVAYEGAKQRPWQAAPAPKQETHVVAPGRTGVRSQAVTIRPRAVPPRVARARERSPVKRAPPARSALPRKVVPTSPPAAAPAPPHAKKHPPRGRVGAPKLLRRPKPKPNRPKRRGLKQPKVAETRRGPARVPRDVERRPKETEPRPAPGGPGTSRGARRS